MTFSEVGSALISQRSSTSLLRFASKRSSPGCSVPASIGCGLRSTRVDQGASSMLSSLSGPGPKLVPLAPESKTRYQLPAGGKNLIFALVVFRNSAETHKANIIVFSYAGPWERGFDYRAKGNKFG